jgi:hypothetical protein
MTRAAELGADAGGGHFFAAGEPVRVLGPERGEETRIEGETGVDVRVPPEHMVGEVLADVGRILGLGDALLEFSLRGDFLSSGKPTQSHDQQSGNEQNRASHACLLRAS